MTRTKPVAVVTGASRGIGLAIAEELVSKGFHVIGTVRDLVSGRQALGAVGASAIVLDVRTPELIESLARHLTSGIDVLVNNAGVALDGFDERVARETIDINTYGAITLTDRLLPLARPGARIVMVSSGMGELSAVSSALRERFLDPNLSREQLTELLESFVSAVAAGTHANEGWPSSAYRVSKIGMNAHTRILARELASDPRGILVNAACPGWVRTRMGGDSAPRSPKEGAETPVYLATLPAGGPSGGFFRDKRPAGW